MPLHRKPRQSPRILAAVLGVVVTVTGVAWAAQVGQEVLTSGPEPRTASSASSRPTSPSAPSAEDRARIRPTRGAVVEREDLRDGAAGRRARGEKAPTEAAATPSRDTTPTRAPVPLPETDTSTVDPTPEPRTAASTPAQTSSSPSSGTGILDRTNAARADAGVAALDANACLGRMAQRHAERLAAQGRLYHQGLSAVMSSCGMSTAGENVAMNHTGPSAMVGQWLRSSGHRANLLSSRFSLIGVGVAQGRDGAWYGVQVFGAR